MVEQQYIDLVKYLLDKPARPTRNGKTRSSFGATILLPAAADYGFSIIQGRQQFYKGVLGELATFLAGNITNVKDFEANGCNYWQLWQDNDAGDIKVDYGNKWRDWNGCDQLTKLVATLTADPYGRRHLITSWDPSNLNNLSLPCCHYAYQFYVTVDGYLEMLWTQRSCDVMIGLPADIILACAFNLLLAQTVGLKAGKIIMSLGDVHIYESHLANVELYLQSAQQINTALPFFTLDEKATVFNFKPEMLELELLNNAPRIDFKLEK